MPRALFAVLILAAPALAQTKEPPLYPPDEATMKQIREMHKTLTDAIAKLPESPFKPDVEVYAKAVEWVTRHGEYWDAKSGEKILAVLAAGQKRAEELAGIAIPKDWNYEPKDIPSWRKVLGKAIIRGYRSTVDGSVQPYAVTFPNDYGGKDTTRIDVVLHGRDATLTEVKFISGKEAAKPVKEAMPYIQVEVYGRGNNAYRWAGESDVFESYGSEVHRVNLERHVLYGRPATPWFDFPTVILRGFSMGGAGTWHIGLHHPFVFSAIGPGAGFSVTKGYVKNLPDPLPDYVERCLHIYDAADYAENAFHVPVIAYAGDKDPQQAATKNVMERLKKVPEIPPITFIVGKDLEHKMPPEYMAMAEVEFRKQGKVRNWRKPEKKIRFVTYTTKYGQVDWIHIDALDRHYDRTVVEATFDAEKPVVKTTNVREFGIGRLYPFPGMPGRIEIDGQTLAVPKNKWAGAQLYASYVPAFRKVDGKWTDATINDPDPKPRPAEKRSGLQGPIDDAFMSEFFVAKPTEAGWYADRDTFLAASLGQFDRVWDKYFRGKLPVQPADEANPADKSRHLVLFGDPRSNPLVKRVVQFLPITWTKDKLVVNGKSYDPATHVPVMIYPNPLNHGKYVVLNTGHTFGEKDLQGTNALLYPHLGDWAVIKPKPTAKEPWAYEVVDAGLFDEFWQFEKK
jgi:hypothetical protein